MIEAFKKMVRNWKDFKGRTGVADFWWATLACFIIMVVGTIIAYIPFAIATGMDNGASAIFTVLGVILMIAMVVLSIFLSIANLAMQIRRIRDAGFPWWFWFVNFIPSVGNVAFIVLLCMSSSDVPRVDWGNPPAVATSTADPTAPVIDITPEEAPVVDESEKSE